MPSPRRRRKEYVGKLTWSQEDALLFRGPVYGYDFDDEQHAREAWAEHGEEISVQQRRDGLTPWAAWAFDGEAPGHSSWYCDLGDPSCNCRLAAA